MTYYHRLLRVDFIETADGRRLRMAWCSCGQRASCDDGDRVRLWIKMHRMSPWETPAALAYRLGRG